jgi:hypothetical protein
METNQPDSLFDMQADGLAQNRLNTISKWSKFIAIVALVMIICTALFLFVARDQIMAAIGPLLAFDSNATGAMLGIAVAAIAFFVIWIVFLLRAAIFIKQGLLSRNSDRIADGFRSFRVFFILSTIYSVLSILGTLTTLINS